jgi:hypothetical protein
MSARSAGRVVSAAVLVAAATWIALGGWRAVRHLSDPYRDSPDALYWAVGITFWAVALTLVAAALVVAWTPPSWPAWLALGLVSVVAGVMPYLAIRAATASMGLTLRDDHYIGWAGMLDDLAAWTGLIATPPPAWMGYAIQAVLALTALAATARALTLLHRS